MPTIIPTRVTECREMMGKSLPELARIIQKMHRSAITERTLRRIEGGQGQPYRCNQRTLDILARTLGVDPNVITGDIPLPSNVEVPKKSSPPLSTEEEPVETRLVKFGDKFVIVEFCGDEDTGRVIASDIEDEAAGLRLSESSALRKRLRELLYVVTHPEGVEQGIRECVDCDDDLFQSEWRATHFLTNIGDSVGIDIEMLHERRTFRLNIKESE